MNSIYSLGCIGLFSSYGVAPTLTMFEYRKTTFQIFLLFIFMQFNTNRRNILEQISADRDFLTSFPTDKPLTYKLVDTLLHLLF